LGFAAPLARTSTWVRRAFGAHEHERLEFSAPSARWSERLEFGAHEW